MKKKIFCIVYILMMATTVANATNFTTNANEGNQGPIHKLNETGVTSLHDGPGEEWNITFGGDRYDIFYTVQQTYDGGYIALGGRDAMGWDNGGDCWLVKTDEQGNIQWNKTFGGRRTDNGHGIQETIDGGYILSAITGSYGAGSMDAWIIKTDANGNEQWNKTFGGTSYDLAEKSIPQTLDGGYLIVGSTISFGTGNSRDGWLIKIDADGNEQWNKTYGTEHDEHFWEVHLTSDGGYVMIGYSSDLATQRRDAWVIKTDDEGNVQWDKKFGPAYQGLSITQCIDGGYLFLAEVKDTAFGGYLNAWMVKTDKDGNEEWNKLFITPIGENRFAVHHNIQVLSDGGYVLTGVTNAETPVYSVGDMWLSKLDEKGNILWEKIIGGSEYDTTYTVDSTADGGFIISGMTKSFGSGDNFNAWLVKVGDYENKRPEKPDQPVGPTSGRSGRDYTYRTSAADPDGEQLYYCWDWGDGNYSEWFDTNEATYQWSYKDNFHIRVMVKDIHGGESGWSDPLNVSLTKNKQYLNLFYYRFQERFRERLSILSHLFQCSAE